MVDSVSVCKIYSAAQSKKMCAYHAYHAFSMSVLPYGLRLCQRTMRIFGGEFTEEKKKDETGPQLFCGSACDQVQAKKQNEECNKREMQLYWKNSRHALEDKNKDTNFEHCWC